MRSSSAGNNEFAEAAARLFAKRATAPLDGVSELPPSPDPAGGWEDSSTSFFSSGLRPGPVLFRTLLLAPLVVVGFLVVWNLRPEPPLAVPPKSVPLKRVAEVKAEVREPVDVPRSPPPVGQEVVEVNPVAVPDPVAAAPPPAEVPVAPLTKDEVKELQSKLAAVGFGPGPVDGVVGPQTQAALRRYAEARGFANPDATRELLSRLTAESSAGK